MKLIAVILVCVGVAMVVLSLKGVAVVYNMEEPTEFAVPTARIGTGILIASIGAVLFRIRRRR